MVLFGVPESRERHPHGSAHIVVALDGLLVPTLLDSITSIKVPAPASQPLRLLRNPCSLIVNTAINSAPIRFRLVSGSSPRPVAPGPLARIDTHNVQPSLSRKFF